MSKATMRMDVLRTCISYRTLQRSADGQCIHLESIQVGRPAKLPSSWLSSDSFTVASTVLGFCYIVPALLDPLLSSVVFVQSKILSTSN